MSGVILTAHEPIFDNPDQVVSFGAGVLMTNFSVLDAFTAVADVVVSPRALLDGHAVVSQAPPPGKGRMSAYQVQGAADPVTNSGPTLALSLPPTIVAGVPFEAKLEFDDADADYVEVFAAVKDLTTHEIIFRGERRVFDSGFSDPAAESTTVQIPPLGPGPYRLIGFVDDGIVDVWPIVTEEHLDFTVAPSNIPAVSTWGLLLMILSMLVAGTIVLRRRSTRIC